MLGELESRTELPPPQMSDMDPRDTVYMPINRSDALAVLCLFVRLLFPVGLELYRL